MLLFAGRDDAHRLVGARPARCVRRLGAHYLDPGRAAFSARPLRHGRPTWPAHATGCTYG